jgi:hypothetical protein
MHDTRAQQPRARRRRAAILGLVLGTLLGTAFAISSGRAIAERQDDPAQAVLDATHLPPLLTLAGEDVVLRYDVTCASASEGAEDEACDAGGTVFVRPGTSGPFRTIPLEIDRDAAEGRHFARVPASIAGSRRGFSYYAILRADSNDATVTLPPGGGAAPHRSLPLGRAVDVSLGRHAFGRARRADARVVEAGWGNGGAEVGLEGGPNVAPVGGSSFDVDGAGNVVVLDQVNRRLLRWTPGAPTPRALPVSVDGTIADLSLAQDGTTYVLEGARAGRAPALRTLDRSGVTLAVTELGERTATQVRAGPAGPVVLQQPSGQWLPVVRDGNPLSVSEQERAGLPGRVLPGGNEVLVLRHGNEIRLALANGDVVRRSWRVTSATPLAEVQLAEPFGDGLLVVVRVYADHQDEFVALVLGAGGLLLATALDSADWAESAPLSRFRLSGSSLYQLGSTQAGIFVDRFDLEVK